MENNKRFTRQFLLAYYIVVMARKNFLVILMLLILLIFAWILPVVSGSAQLSSLRGTSVETFFPSLLFN